MAKIIAVVTQRGILELFIIGGFFLILAVFVLGGFFTQDKGRHRALEGNSAGAAAPNIHPEEQEKFLEDPYEIAKVSFVSAKEDFLEINFSQNKVVKYQDGEAQEEASVLAKGDPQGWGGTPAGLYDIKGKNRVAYSAISEVYMPYALHFYGKYLVHGEPYYPSGQVLQSEYSGGCIRVQNDEMKEVFDVVSYSLPVLVIDKERDGYKYVPKKDVSLPSLTAQSYLVADIDSGFILEEKNSEEIRPIASLTKLMTAVIATEQVDLRKSVRVTDSMLQAFGSTQGFTAGKEYRVVELLYPLLTESSNDVAEAVAGFLGRDRTLSLMNEKADSLFMRNTVYTDPSGLDAGNVSTAQDIFLLARYINNNRPPLWDISKGSAVRSFGDPQFNRAALKNKNVFRDDLSFRGGKSGFLRVSKYTGVFLFDVVTAEGQVRTIAITVLGSDNLSSDVKALHQWAQQQYGIAPHIIQ